jgi:acetylornithine deacetylase/succinyl-diaminopimelate desuccinylase-like protein
MLFAVDMLRQHGFRPAGDLYLASTIHEENGTGNGLILLGERGYRPGGALYLDGRNGNVSLTWSGAGNLLLDVRLPKTDRRQVWVVDRRVEEIGRRLLRERATAFAAHPHYAGSMSANHGISISPVYRRAFERPQAVAALRYHIGISSVEGETNEEIKRWVEDAFREGLSVFDARLTFTYPSAWFEPAHYGADTAVARALIGACTAVRGCPPAIACGTKSDGFIFHHHYRIPVANFGASPYGEGGAHGPNEALPIPALVEMAKVAALTILHW